MQSMLLDRYLPRMEFDSYEDFKENYRCHVPADFNFGFDIVDEWARQEPEKMALVWCNDHEEEKTLYFYRYQPYVQPGGQLLSGARRQKRDRRYADSAPPLGILDLRHRTA